MVFGTLCAISLLCHNKPGVVCGKSSEVVKLSNGLILYVPPVHCMVDQIDQCQNLSQTVIIIILYGSQ